jgi:molybdopterin converting factor subunit 1
VASLTVRCFASLNEVLGAEEVSVEVPEGATVSDLLTELVRRYPELDARLSATAVAVNRRLAAEDDPVGPDDEIALLPPVSGG